MSTSSYHRGALRQTLIDHAVVLLRGMGPADLSLRAVARAVGVSAMAPYRHFADKDALLAATAAHGFDLFAEALRCATESEADPIDGLRAQGVAYVRFAVADPSLFRLMFGPMIGGSAGLEALRASGEPAFQGLERAVARAAPNLAPQGRKDLTLACWSIVHGLACLLVDGKIERPDDLDVMTDRMLSLLLRPVPLSPSMRV